MTISRAYVGLRVKIVHYYVRVHFSTCTYCTLCTDINLICLCPGGLTEFSLRHFLLNVLYSMHYSTTTVSKTCFTILKFCHFSKDFALICSR